VHNAGTIEEIREEHVDPQHPNDSHWNRVRFEVRTRDWEFVKVVWAPRGLVELSFENTDFYAANGR